ncbi:hypothetical protein IJC60_05035 [bacterium]|nr:hypothetical protein [bacterium]
MGFSADQSMVLLSKANMDSLEGRRADINNEKMALMREQETLALSYNEAMSNTCFVSKNQQTGEYEAVEFTVNNAGEITKIDGDQGYLGDVTIKHRLTAEQAKAMNNNNGAQVAATYIKNGCMDIYNSKGEQISMAEMEGISESYYTADDAAAKSEYDAAMAKIRSKETKLDMDLEQVETQYQAMKTQYESARQLVNQRAQGDFKFFQG